MHSRYIQVTHPDRHHLSFRYFAGTIESILLGDSTPCRSGLSSTLLWEAQNSEAGRPPFTFSPSCVSEAADAYKIKREDKRHKQKSKYITPPPPPFIILQKIKLLYFFSF
jgi:hypothetical protein